MFPVNTRPEEEAKFAAIGHAKGVAAALALPRPRGIRLRQRGNAVALVARQRFLVSGLIMYVIALLACAWQWRTWGKDIREGEIFHQILWGVIGCGLFFGTIGCFLRLRLRFQADALLFSQPIWGIGWPTTVYWEEIKSIGKGAIVATQDEVPMPGGRGGTGGHLGVASTIKVKTYARGMIQFGEYLSEPHRTYLREAIVAYTKAWRAAVATALLEHQSASLARNGGSTLPGNQ